MINKKFVVKIKQLGADQYEISYAYYYLIKRYKPLCTRSISWLDRGWVKKIFSLSEMVNLIPTVVTEKGICRYYDTEYIKQSQYYSKRFDNYEKPEAEMITYWINKKTCEPSDLKYIKPGAHYVT